MFSGFQFVSVLSVLRVLCDPCDLGRNIISPPRLLIEYRKKGRNWDIAFFCTVRFSLFKLIELYRVVYRFLPFFSSSQAIDCQSAEITKTGGQLNISNTYGFHFGYLGVSFRGQVS